MDLYIAPVDAAHGTEMNLGTLRAMLAKSGGQFRRRRIGGCVRWLLIDYVDWANRVLRPPLDIRRTERLIAPAIPSEDYHHE